MTMSPEHRWGYFPDMTRDEVLLIQQWDSRGDLAGGTEGTTVCIHAAFPDPSLPAGGRRESVEVRVLCVD